MKVAGRILATMIAMVAIMLIAVGADKGLNYLEQRKYEKELIERSAQEHAQAEQLRTRIQELSQDTTAVETFLNDYSVSDLEDEDEDVLQEYLTASPEDNVQGEDEASGEQQEDGNSEDRNPVDVLPEEGISEDSISGNENNNLDDSTMNSDTSDDVKDVSGNDNITDDISENDISGNDISGNNISGNDISGSSVSGNEVSDSTVSGNGISVSTVSGNILIRPSLRERKLESSSYADTVEWNDADQAVIEESSLDFSDIKITCLGDSITQAANLTSMEDYQQYSYPTKLGQILGAKEVVNLGIGGSSIGRYWQNAFVDRYQEIPQDTDLILVMGGTNDGFCLHKENVGNFEERLAGTLIGDLDELMRGLKDNYPDAEVIFITPLPNVLHDILRKERPELLSQRVIVDSMIALAQEYEFDVIDLYDSNLLDSHDAAVISNYMPDGVHCNPDGYQILAEHIAADLIRMQGDSEDADHTEHVDEVENVEGTESQESVEAVEYAENTEDISGNDLDSGDEELSEKGDDQIPTDVLKFN